jgi:radical SAM superfamily enzyme YgiQ (UPF0313 family)
MLKSKAKQIISIALDWTRPKDPPISLGQAAIVANLKHHEIPFVQGAWAVNDENFKAKDVANFVMQHQSPDSILAIGGFIWNEKALQEILTTVKQEGFTGKTLLGGPQVSYTQSGLEKIYPQVDIFVRGYAEDAIVQLSKNNHSRGIHYAHQPDLGLSAAIDLEKLPSPYLTGLIQPQRFIRWETQRGCPFKCSFCQHRESSPMKERKLFGLPRVIQEARWITENPVIQDVAVVDPTFNSGENYLKVLHALADGKFSGKLALQARAEMVTPEFLDAIERVNQHGLVVLEFGLQTIHAAEQKLIDRPNNMKKVSRVLHEITARGISSEISLIFGLPGQTTASFLKSIEFCINHKIPVIHAFPLMLLRGTPLFHKKEEFGLIESSTEIAHNLPRVQEDIPHVITSPTFTYEDWQKMASMAEWLEEHYNPLQKSSAPVRFSPVENTKAAGSDNHSSIMADHFKFKL